MYWFILVLTISQEHYTDYRLQRYEEYTWLKSVYIYGSYRKIKTGVTLFGPLSVCHTGRAVKNSWS